MGSPLWIIASISFVSGSLVTAAAVHYWQQQQQQQQQQRLHRPCESHTSTTTSTSTSLSLFDFATSVVRSHTIWFSSRISSPPPPPPTTTTTRREDITTTTTTTKTKTNTSSSSSSTSPSHYSPSSPPLSLPSSSSYSFGAPATATTPTTKRIPYHIRQEQLSRHTLYFGSTGMKYVQNASICIVGVGGVGSHVAISLARSGIRYLRLIDYDQISLSSLNRHACATLSDVGLSKATVVQRYIDQLCPDSQYLQVDARTCMYHAPTAHELLSLDDIKHEGNENHDTSSSYSPSLRLQWTLIIDAIDDVPTKSHLIAYCLHHHIRCISCMGAGGKADPTRIHIGDLRSATKDPLATKVRQELRKLMAKHHGDYNNNINNNHNKKPSSSVTNGTVDDTASTASTTKIKEQVHEKEEDNEEETISYLDRMEDLAVIYSSEKTVVKLADVVSSDQITSPQEYGTMDHMRIRVVPVLGTMPAIMGYSMAALALTEIGSGLYHNNNYSNYSSGNSHHDTESKNGSIISDSTISGPPRMQPIPAERVGRQARNKVFQQYRQREEKITKRLLQSIEPIDHNDIVAMNQYVELSNIVRTTGSVVNGSYIGPIAITQDDVEYLLEIWRNRCAVTNARLGVVLALVRWDMSLPGTCNNLVLMSTHYISSKFDKFGRSCVPMVQQRDIEQRLAQCKLDRDTYIEIGGI
jgi:tRNA A37 threonylcarbamoyladenosine dehydratase